MGGVWGGHLLLQYEAVQCQRQGHPRPGQPRDQRHHPGAESVTD